MLLHINNITSEKEKLQKSLEDTNRAKEEVDEERLQLQGALAFETKMKEKAMNTELTTHAQLNIEKGEKAQLLRDKEQLQHALEAMEKEK